MDGCQPGDLSKTLIDSDLRQPDIVISHSRNRVGQQRDPQSSLPFSLRWEMRETFGRANGVYFPLALVRS